MLHSYNYTFLKVFIKLLDLKKKKINNNNHSCFIPEKNRPPGY